MATYKLPGDGQHVFNPFYNQHAQCLVISGAQGQVVVEARPTGTEKWFSVPNGTVDAADPHIVRFTGPVDEYRFTVTGSSGEVVVTETNTTSGQGVDYQAVQQTFEDVLRSGPDGFYRLRVDNGEPGFWYGRQFGFDFEIAIPNGGRQVVKFEIPIDTVVLESTVSVDTGTLRFQVYPASVITEDTAFTTPVPLVPLSTLSFTPSYTPVTTVTTGGTVTVDPGANPFPLRRIRTSNSTAQQTNVSGDAGVMRGIAPGTIAYVVMGQLAGSTGSTSGVYSVRLEERTWEY